MNEARGYLNLFEKVALLGPATFLQSLIPSERLATEYSEFNEKNSRNFLLLRILIELQKAGFAFGRWRKFLAVDDLNRSVEELSSVERLELESYIDEQSQWQRKLSEGLVLLINFSTTNNPSNYYHFLLFHELRGKKSRALEQERYFNQPSKGTHQKVEAVATRIAALEKTVDLTNCWYLDQRGKRKKWRMQLTKL